MRHNWSSWIVKRKATPYVAGYSTRFCQYCDETQKKTIEKTVFVIHYQNRYLLFKRPDKGLLASLYEFYNVEMKFKKEEAIDFLKQKGFDIKKTEDLYNGLNKKMPPHELDFYKGMHHAMEKLKDEMSHQLVWRNNKIEYFGQGGTLKKQKWYDTPFGYNKDKIYW